MELLLNDLSLHGQFASIRDFQDAIQSIMLIRNKMRQFDRELYCYRNLTQAKVTQVLTLQQAIQQFDLNNRRAVMGWLTQHGPFWEDVRNHEPDDYLECQGQVVTDTALGEAAYRCFSGATYQLVSLSPSNWTFTPISIVWQGDRVASIEVTNHWEICAVEAALRAAVPPLKSWEQLASVMPSRCANLIFATDSFESLYGHPFIKSAAQRIVELLETLDRFKGCFDERGQRTAEGNKIYQEHFTGKKAWFTDSSDSEKEEFDAKFTFKHPEKHNESISCTWHGKVKTPQLRIHFSWPIRSDELLYVVYIGPKLTKK